MTLSNVPASRHDRRLPRFLVVTCVMLGVAVLAVGCGRETSEADSSASGSVSDPSQNVSRGAPVAPAEVQPQTLEVAEDAAPDAVLDELNRELRKWVARNRRKPANFEEFVGSAQMQVPPPPAGKKYTLTSNMRIELVDN